MSIDLSYIVQYTANITMVITIITYLNNIIIIYMVKPLMRYDDDDDDDGDDDDDETKNTNDCAYAI